MSASCWGWDALRSQSVQLTVDVSPPVQPQPTRRSHPRYDTITDLGRPKGQFVPGLVGLSKALRIPGTNAPTWAVCHTMDCTRARAACRASCDSLNESVRSHDGHRITSRYDQTFGRSRGQCCTPARPHCHGWKRQLACAVLGWAGVPQALAGPIGAM